MRLDHKEIIAGQSIKRVRDFLRIDPDGRYASDDVIRFFNVNRVIAYTIVKAMLDRGLIAIAVRDDRERQTEIFTVTELGMRFAAARLLKPISRAKAEEIVSDLLARVEQINARDDLTHFVGEVRAFGSFITGARELGDIDLAISFVAKPPPIGIEFIAWHLDRARRSGRAFRSYIEELFYAEKEVRRLVQQRNRYVSIHPMRELDELKIESRSLYKSVDRPVYVR